MSRREDILSSIDVTIMDRTAGATRPSSDSKTFPVFGAGAAVTHTAGLGGKSFIDFIEPHACVSAFILQHGSKCAPTRVLVLHPQTQDSSRGRSMTGHAYSITDSTKHGQKSKTKGRAMHAALSLSGLKAGVSPGEFR
jgi:hypothetical protein